MPKHAPRRYGRQDPRGSQKLFWLLIILAAITGFGFAIATNPDFFGELFR